MSLNSATEQNIDQWKRRMKFSRDQLKVLLEGLPLNYTGTAIKGKLVESMRKHSLVDFTRHATIARSFLDRAIERSMKEGAHKILHKVMEECREAEETFG